MTHTVPSGPPGAPRPLSSTAAISGGQFVTDDGRAELLHGAYPEDSRFANDDLRPVPLADRHWGTYNFTALWVGMAHNIPSWTLASGLVALGMDWKQAVMTIAVANVIVLVPMLLTGHAGPKYGIPFPVLARASFGLRGANLPALVRAAVACGWFGIQTWIGGQGIYVLLNKAYNAHWDRAQHVAGYPWTLWVCFGAFWLLQMVIMLRGMETLRRFENWAGPFVIVGALVLLWWMSRKAGGFGPLLDEPSKLGWGADFWPVFFPALMGMIGFWSTLSLNIPDFTRFGKGQRAQVWGQTLGLPTTMTAFALLSVLVTSGSQAVYGEPIWEPVDVAAKAGNTGGLLFALIMVLIATVSTNLAANVVSPSYDLANLAPKIISFRTGSVVTGIVGVVIFPWKLIATPQFYIYVWLGVVGGLLGTVAGILIADYWFVRRTRLDLVDLYTKGGRYWYAGGWNWRAVVAFLVGGVLAVGGSHSEPGQGPFPRGGLIPVLKPLADYGWAIGLASAFVVYVLLMSGARRTEAERRSSEQETPDTAA